VFAKRETDKVEKRPLSLLEGLFLKIFSREIPEFLREKQPARAG
jgi:hypothetical protein